MTDRKPIDPAHLVPGAKVMIEGTVERVDGNALSLQLERSGRYTVMADDSAIVSVTPPPVDWSKVIGKKVQTNFSGKATLLAVHGNDCWLLFDHGKSLIWSLEDITPLPNEPSAGEASNPCRHRTIVPDSDGSPMEGCRLEFHDEVCTCSTQPDTRPAWQRAKVGDVVRHLNGNLYHVLEVSPHKLIYRLKDSLGNHLTSPMSDILDIVEKADANR